MDIFVSIRQFAVAGAVTMFLVCSASVAVAESTDSQLTAYMEAVNAWMPPNGDPATVAELFAEDGVQYHPNGAPGTQRGRAELAKFFGGFSSAWADWTHIEKHRLVQGNHAVWEGTAEGHHKASRKFVRIPIVFFLDFDNQGKVVEDRVYVDGHLIGEQLK
jgi:ketosteroid isomerase-like protein